MCLNPAQIKSRKRLFREEADAKAELRQCDSRLDDGTHVGDVDLLLELVDTVAEPAMHAARAGRIVETRNVGVLPSASNLRRHSIHDVAMRQGVLL